MGITGGPGPNPHGQQPQPPQPLPNLPYAPPAGAGYGYPAAGPPGGFGPVTPPPAGSRGTLPSWLWAVGGVVVASAVWGAVLVATADGSQNPDPERPRPNLAGYAYTADMCAAADTTAFDADYEPEGYRDPSGTAFEHRAVDRSACTFYLTPAGGGSLSSLFLTYEAVWHKRSDPRPEFAATYRGQEQYQDVNYDYEVEPISGLGDEAFLVYLTDSNDDGRLARVVLAVRDGWFEHRLTWDAYIDPTDPAVSHLLDREYVTEALRESSEATLAALRGGPAQPRPDPSETEYQGDVKPDV